MAAPFDTLRLARALRDKAGFSQEHAEATADALADAVAGQMATKQDLKDLAGELRSEIAALRTELHSGIAALRAEMTAGFRDAEQRVTIRLGGMLVVMTGILLATKFFG
ncbi:MAG TPA: hypothetical protein VG651_10845 [Stellaceae bacterium]|nr:hypothetical protein [Stellaceae bacterium]